MCLYMYIMICSANSYQIYFTHIGAYDCSPATVKQMWRLWIINTLRPRQDGCLFPDDISKSIFFNENIQILIKISLTFVSKAPINNIPALVLIMAWRRPGDKPLSEPMMVSLLTHICVTWPQWVKKIVELRTGGVTTTRQNKLRLCSCSLWIYDNQHWAISISLKEILKHWIWSEFFQQFWCFSTLVGMHTFITSYRQYSWVPL